MADKRNCTRAVYISFEGAKKAAEAFREGFVGPLDYVKVVYVHGKGGHMLGWGVLYKPYYGTPDWIME